MAEKSSGSLAQKYAQIIMGFLSEAIIKFQALKATKQAEPKSLIVAPGFQAVLNKIESAFGSFNLEQAESEQNEFPVISRKELDYSIMGYLAQHNIPFEPAIYQAVFQDLFKLFILTSQGLPLENNGKNPLYAINTGFFADKTIEKSCFNLKEVLDGKFKTAIKNPVAKEILLTLAFTVAISEDELQNLPPQYCRGIFFQRFGRGMLLSMLRRRGIKYGPFMKTVDLLVKSNILIEGCHECNNEFIILNPSLKPFSVIREVISAFDRTKQETSLVEVEIIDNETSPLGSMINIGSWGGDSRDIYLFNNFEIGLEGL